MRSALPGSNHHSPSPTTHALAVAMAALPASSSADARSTISPECFGRDLAQQQAVRIRAPRAAGIERRDAQVGLISVEAADEAFAIGVVLARIELHVDRVARQRAAVEIERHDLEAQLVAARRPAFHAQTQAHRGRPQRHARRRRQALAVGVLVFQLGDEVHRRGRWRGRLASLPRARRRARPA